MATLADWERAIGRVAIAGGQLERAAAGLEMALLGARHGSLLITGQGWSVTKQACTHLIDAWIADVASPAFARDLTQLRALLTTADDRMESRNIVVHGQWLAPPEGSADDVLIRLERRWGRAPQKSWTLAKLDQLVEDLQTASNEIAFNAFTLSNTEVVFESSTGDE